MTITQVNIRRQAQAIAACVEVAHPGALARLGDDALAELAAWAEVQVKWVPDQDVGEGCSVAGSYNSDIRPPALCIALSASPGRRQFTALHEVGHHVQQNNAELGAVVIMSADSEALEEGACNLFAGQTLLPEDVVNQHVGARGPSAAEVADLFAGSQASRAACCVGAAERLRSPGAVVLLDYDGVVSFAQPAGGFIPPAARLRPVRHAAGIHGVAQGRSCPDGNFRPVPHRRQERYRLRRLRRRRRMAGGGAGR